MWYGVDPLAHKYPQISPFTYVANNPVNAIDPNGKYILPAPMAQKYSKLANYLQNGMSNLLQNDKIRSGLRLIGNFTDSQIDKLGKYDEGITINLKQLDNDEVDHPQGSEKNGNAYGKTNNFYIDETLAIQLQNATTPEEEASALLGIVSTILHETIHVGENGYGKGNRPSSDGSFSKEPFYNERTGDKSFYYYYNNIGVGSTGDSGKAFENAIWDFGGKLTGMKQGEQGKKDQMVRYILNYFIYNTGVLPKTD